MKLRITALTLVAIMLMAFASTTMAYSSSATWSGSGTYRTVGSIAKPDSTSSGRYVWHSPVEVAIDYIPTWTVIYIQPVNANGVTMGPAENFYTIGEGELSLTNVNYMHIHLKIQADSGVYTEGDWTGEYSFKAN